MNAERWAQIETLCQAALDLSSDEQDAFLESACASDPALRQEVESLLAHRAQDKSFIDGPAVQLLAQALMGEAGPEGVAGLGGDGAPKGEDPSRFIGRVLSRYRVLEKLASGGMGDVFLAERADGVYEQRVALKVVQSARNSDYFLARFQSERQILASLNHPHIARLIDGGSEDGLPFLVMELVKGRPIDQFCDEEGLGLRERLELFRLVCGAVQYAHQRLVVHRDLKPMNILVTAERVPKLLDFGIAKVLGPQEGEKEWEGEGKREGNAEEKAGHAETGAQLRILTPEFASPEQVLGSAVSTSSDVYSLGLILAILLTGRHPYASRSLSVPELVRAVCEAEPEKPSASVLKSSPGTPQEKSRRRKALAGDLDHIVLKALRKEPGLRYPSAEHLSEDLGRYLAGQPVLARTGSLSYRVKKFVARHRLGVAAAALVFLSLAGGLVATLREARIARAERSRAEARFNDVRSLANSLIFDVHDSIKGLAGSTAVRKKIVEQALVYLSRLAADSHGDVALQRELGEAYERVGMLQGYPGQNSLGDIKGSLESLERALHIREEVERGSTRVEDLLALARSHRVLAGVLDSMGDARARLEMEAAVGLSEKLAREHPGDAKILLELTTDYSLSRQYTGTTLPEDAARNGELLSKALDADQALVRLAPEDVEAQYRYAMDLTHLADSIEAAPPAEQIRAQERALEAFQRLREKSADVRFGRMVARTYDSIGGLYADNSDLVHALEFEQRALSLYEELSRVDPQNMVLQRGVGISSGNVADKLSRLGQSAESIGYADRSVEILKKLAAGAPEDVMHKEILQQTYVTRAQVLARAQRLDPALADLSHARALAQDVLQVDPHNSDAATALGECAWRTGRILAAKGDSARAAAEFRKAVSSLEATGTEPRVSSAPENVGAFYGVADAYEGLGDLSELKGEHAEAASWYQKSLDAWRRIEHPGRTSPQGYEVGGPEEVEKKLEAARAGRKAP